MAPEMMKKQAPEDMLIRIMRVAEILIRGNSATSTSSIMEVKPVDQPNNNPAEDLQKTQQ